MLPVEARARVQGALVALTGLASLAWLPVTQGVYAARYAALLLVVACWAVAWVTGVVRLSVHRLRALWIAGGAACTTVLLAAVLSPDPGAALTWGAFGLTSAPVWCAWVVIACLVSSVRLVRETRAAVAVTVSVLVAAGWVQLVGARTGAYGLSPFVNADYLGPMFVATGALAVAVALSGDDRLRWAWFGVAAASGTGVLLAGSLAATIGLVVAVAFGGALYWRVRTGSRLGGGRALALAGALALAAVTVFTAVALVQHGRASWVDRVAAADPGIESRLLIWQAAARAIADAPLAGSGSDRFAYAASPHLGRAIFLGEPSENPQDSLPSSAHSLPVTISVEMGLLGLVAFSVLGVMWLRSAWPDPSVSAKAAAFKLACTAGVIGWFTSALFLPESVVLGGLVPLAAGLACSGPEARVDPLRSPASRAAVAAIPLGLALWLALGAVFGWTAFTSVSSATTPQEYARRLGVARSWQPTFPLYASREVWLAGAVPGDAEASGARAALVAAPASVREFAPYLVEYADQGCEAAAAGGRSDLAWERAVLDDAEALAPNLPTIDIARIKVALIEGDLVTARRLVAENSDLSGRYGSYDTLAEQTAAAQARDF